MGMAYRIAADQVDGVLAHLDYREKNGYERLTETIDCNDGRSRSALIYIATPDNFAHLGDASDLEIAQQIHASAGPSGSNREYLFELHKALHSLDADDPHVSTLYKLVQQMQ